MAARNIVREVYSALSSSEESGSKYDYDNDDSALVLIATLLILLSLLTLVTQISLVTLVVQWHICLHILLLLLYYYYYIERYGNMTTRLYGLHGDGFMEGDTL